MFLMAAGASGSGTRLFDGSSLMTIVLLLTSALLILFAIMAIRLRGYLIGALNEISNSIIGKFFTVSDVGGGGGSQSSSTASPSSSSSGTNTSSAAPAAAGAGVSGALSSADKAIKSATGGKAGVATVAAAGLAGMGAGSAVTGAVNRASSTDDASPSFSGDEHSLINTYDSVSDEGAAGASAASAFAFDGTVSQDSGLDSTGTAKASGDAAGGDSDSASFVSTAGDSADVAPDAATGTPPAEVGGSGTDINADAKQDRMDKASGEDLIRAVSLASAGEGGSDHHSDVMQTETDTARSVSAGQTDETRVSSVSSENTASNSDVSSVSAETGRVSAAAPSGESAGFVSADAAAGGSQAAVASSSNNTSSFVSSVSSDTRRSASAFSETRSSADRGSFLPIGSDSESFFSDGSSGGSGDAEHRLNGSVSQAVLRGAFPQSSAQGGGMSDRFLYSDSESAGSSPHAQGEQGTGGGISLREVSSRGHEPSHPDVSVSSSVSSSDSHTSVSAGAPVRSAKTLAGTPGMPYRFSSQTPSGGSFRTPGQSSGGSDSTHLPHAQTSRMISPARPGRMPAPASAPHSPLSRQRGRSLTERSVPALDIPVSSADNSDTGALRNAKPGESPRGSSVDAVHSPSAGSSVRNNLKDR